MKKKKNKGFSVIEIVLVLGVIGILSSFIAP
ncbi:MAG: type II secretion system protein, partial [Cetobacterium sp.]